MYVFMEKQIKKVNNVWMNSIIWTYYYIHFVSVIFQIVDSLIVEVIRRKPDLKVLNYYGEEFVHI